MQFKSFCEIENVSNNKLINQAIEMGFTKDSITWVAETKIDGSNFQCSIDADDNFVLGTRNHFIGKEESFQGYERAMRNENVEAKLRQIKTYLTAWNDKNYFDNIKDIISDKFILTVYGELCGGMYRHKDVDRIKGAQKIMGRIDYNPDNMWVPFDIVIHSEVKNLSYMFDQTDVKDLCQKFDLPFPIIKCIGTFEECLKYPNDFIDDTGNILWNLPIIEENIVEGVVIKPNKAMWFNNGQRVIFKNKNNKFKERVCKAPKDPKGITPMNELELKYYELAREFITENRLMSVFSKVGEVNEKAFGMILGMYLKDLWKDFDKEYEEEIESIEKKTMIDEFNFSKIRKEISKEVTNEIRPMFVERLNN